MRKPDRKSVEPEDEARQFREAVRGVKPLSKTGVPAGLVKPKTRKKRAPMPAADAESPSHGPPLIEIDAMPDETLSFRRAGVQDQMVKRLRRGLIPTEAQIDLHGMTQHAAWDCLTQFLNSCREKRVRCVRIVHGKGYRSGARGPVLKSAVNSWLRRSHDVLAFTSARAIDGGTGALYVLLRA